MASAGGLALAALAPSAAFAACNPGNFDGGAVEVCSGVDVTITETVTGDQTVILADQTVTGGGIDLDAAADEDIALVMSDLGIPVPVGDVTNLAGAGISLTSGGGALLVTTIPGGEVTGTTNGIEATTTGAGAVEINTGDTVTGGPLGNGIYVQNGAGAVDVNVGDAVSGYHGVHVQSAGAVTVDVDGDITATRYALRIGVAGTAPSSADVTVGAGSTITGALGGAGHAIHVRAIDATVAMDGDLVAGNGIWVDGGAGGGTVSIGGNVTATGRGVTIAAPSGAATFNQTGGTISADSATDAAVTVVSGGPVTLATAAGATINGVAGGLYVNVGGGGGAGVTGVLDGDIGATSGDAVSVTIGGSGDVDLTFNGTIIGGSGAGDDGVSITSTGTGDINLVTNGVVSGDPGVVLVGGGGGGDIDYDANNDVSGTDGAILASNVGIGGIDISVNNAGTDIDGTNGGAGAYGIQATTVNGDLLVSSEAGTTIIGDTYGVTVETTGTGDIALEFAGDVTGGSDEAILAVTDSGDIGIATHAGSVLASGSHGIDAVTQTGGIDMDLAGDIGTAVASVGGDGVNATIDDAGSTTTLDVNVTGAIYADDDGLDVEHDGDGAIVVAAGPITAGSSGIEAYGNGAGSVTVTANGAIDAGDHGIDVESETGDIDITTAAAALIDAGDDGIRAVVNGASGGISIDAAGGVGAPGDLIGGTGVYAEIVDGGNADTISVTAAGGVFADTFGIDVQQGGLGGVTVSAGAIEANNEHGINVEIGNAANTGAIMITANGPITTGDEKGVKAETAGLGLIDIDVLGAIDSDDMGVQADITNAASAASIDIDVDAAVTAASDIGIEATNDGTGTTTVTTSAAVSGTEGIVVDGGGGLVTVGAGAMVTGSTGAGIDAVNSGEIAIMAGDVSGATDGITAFALGDITVTSTGTVDGAGDDGIAGTSFGGSVNLTASTATGASSGAVALALGGGDASVTGNVHLGGAAGYGGFAMAIGGGDASVGIADDATVDATDSGLVALSGSGSASVATGDGSEIVSDDTGIMGLVLTGAGDVVVTTGDDSLIEAAASGITTINLGAGDVSVTTGDDSVIDAAVTGITAIALGGGNVSVTTGAGSMIDPDDFGVLSASAAGEADVVTGAGSTIIVNDDIDATSDFTNVGIYAESGLAADVAAGDPTVEVDLGADTSIAVTRGTLADMDGAVGVFATNSSGDVDGSVSITAADGLTVAVTSDNAAGLLGFAEGDVTVTTGTGDIDVVAVDGATALTAVDDVTGVLSMDPISIGVAGVSTGGDVIIDTAANVNVTTVGTDIDTIGIGASASNGAIGITSSGTVTSQNGDAIAALGGLGGISIVASGALNATNGDGILAEAGGAIGITNSATIAGTATDGIHATAGGAISVINSGALGTSGNRIDNGILTSITAGSGATNVTNNGSIFATNVGISTATAGTGSTSVTNTAAINVTTAGGRGIQTAATSGGTTVTTSGAITANDDGVNTTATTGTTTIHTRANVTSSAASAIDATSTSGTVNINNDATLAGAATAANPIIQVNKTGGSTTINNDTTGQAGAGVIGSSNSALALDVNGGSLTVNNRGTFNGRVDVSGTTGATFNNVTGTGLASTWNVTGVNTFSGGNDTINNQTSGTGTGVINATGTTSFDLGGGADTLTNAGTLNSGSAGTAAATTFAFGAGADAATNSGTINANGTLTFSDLEAFTNTGLINLQLDGAADDVVAMTTATAYTGGGTLAVDTMLGGTAQADCSVAGVSDCLAILGGTTSGTTEVNVNDISGAAFGAFNPDGIVLVDVSGGTSAEGDFVLDPTSDFWRADPSSTDGVLDKGLFFYDLAYDDATQQHLLVGLPDQEVFEFPVLALAAQTVWHTTTGTWFDRQADLRNTLAGLEPGATGGAWLRITGNWANRDQYVSYDSLGTNYEFNVSHDQRTVALVGGVDLVNVVGDTAAFVAGITGGYVDSDIRFATNQTRSRFEGTTLGAYATYATGAFFVDGIINANYLDVDHESPNIGTPAVLSDRVDSIGGQVEGGFRLPVNEGSAFLEPLFTLAYVQTDFGDLEASGTTFDYGDITSLRGALGLRLSGDMPLDTFTVKFGATGRVWEELEGENPVVVVTGGPDLLLVDDFSGTLADLGVDLNVFSADARLGAFAKVGVKFKEDYESTDASIGFRYTW